MRIAEVWHIVEPGFIYPMFYLNLDNSYDFMIPMEMVNNALTNSLTRTNRKLIIGEKCS